MSERELNMLELEEAISRRILMYVKYTYSLLIDDPTADTMKNAAREAVALQQPAGELDIRGRNLVSGLPETIRIQPREIERVLYIS